MNSYTIFRTKAGWMGAVASPTGLRQTTLPQASPEAVRALLGDLLGDAVLDGGTLCDLVGRLRGYFEGQPVDFPDALDLEGVTCFYRQVWQVTRSIPYGQTRSYAWVAGELGRPRGSRAVGQALGRNLFPIVVPCHRVLGSDGSLCGFGGGLALKHHLLELESRGRAACYTFR